VSKDTFSKEEISQELERRHRVQRELDESRLRPRTGDTQCIHCGLPYSTATASAARYGLCDDCLHGGD
jgi:hypothetical protein